MGSLPQHLHRLEARLAALGRIDDDVMLATEFDGFIAGIVVCPDPIRPREWLPVVLGAAANWSGREAARRDCVRLLLEHHDRVARTLRGGHYAPVFDVDPRHDEILWELWADGFGRAMALRPDGWRMPTHDGGDGEAAALAGMRELVALATREGGADTPSAAVLTETAPTLIPGWIEALHGWRLRHAAAGQCRCGSDRPYEACCGLN